ncbi:MAG: RsmG family class I SAM-dependent methyltransferase [Actinomycetota bacterium]
MTPAGPAGEGGPLPAEAHAEALAEVLEESRDLGFLGPGPLGPQVDHARGFASVVGRAPASFLDLGAGGGLPGLVLASGWPSAQAVLLDASARRTDFLRRACTRLGFGDRVTVVCARAEVAGRDPGWRGRFDLVVARSFGPPAVTAECGAGFLGPGGRLVVSEPPDDEGERWPVAGLDRLGLVRQTGPGAEFRYAVLGRAEPLGPGFPRRDGMPRKRPLWA